MLDLRQDGSGLTLRGNEYELAFPEDDGASALPRVRDVPMGKLHIAGVCDADGQRDEIRSIGTPVVERELHKIAVVLPAQSSLWGTVHYVFDCYHDRIEHFARRRGSRYLDDLHFFAAPNEGRFSEPGWTQVFDPEPNARRKHYFDAAEFATIGVSSDRAYYRGNWLFTPGPLCYAFAIPANGWLGCGIAAALGTLNFDHYEYRGSPAGFGLTLRYGWHTKTLDDWESPRLVLFAADDEYATVGDYCASTGPTGTKPARFSKTESVGAGAAWWHEPIFCGWGEQVALERRTSVASVPPITAADLCTQANYERFLPALEERGIRPGTIVLDDKWQGHYGLNEVDRTKWPDIHGFVAKQHANGKRVLLWLRAWSPEGLPAEECLLDNEGRPLAVDPTNERYEARLRGQIREMLAGSGADGFKIDFTHCLPTEDGVRSARGIWGIELLKYLIATIHDEAKACKPDALIMAHTANPYFADVVDMLRLNDIANVVGEPDYVESMRQRTSIAKLASPDWIIDTDNWPSPNRATWLEYCRLQAELGVPSLYYVTRVYYLSEDGVVTDEELRDEDYAEIGRLWQSYRERRRLA